MTTTEEVAARLVELCRIGDFAGAQRQLFADDAVSIEMDGSTAKGREALAEKGKGFNESFEVRGGSATDPVVAGDFFSCAMTVEVVDRKSGAPMTLSEICVYEVKDGKIVREQFFFRRPGES